MFSALRVPVIAAPMAGGPSTPALVAGAGDAGGFGFLAGGYLTPAALVAQIDEVRSLTDAPFGVNLFRPGTRSTVDISGYRARVAAEAHAHGTEAGSGGWDDDHYGAKLDVVVAQRVPAVSFTFGVPPVEDIARLRGAGATVVVTVTTAAEARLAERSGADVLCVQGAEAGGHRGVFHDDDNQPGGGEMVGTFAALRLVAAEVGLPLIATGGLITGADVAAALVAGAVAAQLGTAFLLCPEAGTSAPHRAALIERARATAVTRAFSGRPARGLVNRFLVENTPHAPAAYPQVHHLTKPVRASGDPEVMSMWAGQTYPLATEVPVGELVKRLDDEARGALAAAARRFGV